MNIGELIQNIATGGAVLLGLTYVVGGLIVNLNLTRRGIIEFEILKTKYLVVGLVFLLHIIGIFTFAAIFGFFLFLVGENQLIIQLINLVCMLSAGSMLLVWARYPSNTESWLGDWWYWFIASTVAAIFPMFVLTRQLLNPQFDIFWSIVSFQAILTGALTFLSQAYHYSAFYYGRMHGLGALDPIGVGIPTRVQLACDEKMGILLKGLGVPVSENGITDDLFLVDETSQHYIISFQREADSTENTLKVGKDSVKAILFKPDHMKKLGGEKPVKAKK
jgi:hypothetical protein